MKCPFKKIVTHSKQVVTSTTMNTRKEDFAECDKAECPFYNEHGTDKCRKVERELK